MNLELPFGIRLVNPGLLDAWAGPYVSVEEANAIIPIEVRTQTRLVGIVSASGVGKLYMYKDGVADTDLVEVTGGKDLLRVAQDSDFDRVDLASKDYTTLPVLGSLTVANDIEDGELLSVTQIFTTSELILSRSINISTPQVYPAWRRISVGADDREYWNAKQNPLGFTPEVAGVAASLITALKNGVVTEGDTLKKLYDLIISGYSEVTVATIAARNAYNVTKLPTNVFVLDDGDGKWALYKAITTGVNATYVKISDPDLLNNAMTASQIKSAYESNADTNAFTDVLLSKLTAFTANFTSAMKTAYDDAVTKAHTHTNKIVLDAIEQAFTTALKTSYDAHLADTTKHITSGERTAWNAKQPALPFPQTPVGYYLGDDGVFHSIVQQHSQATQPNGVPNVQHIDSTSEKATIVDADSVVIWNSVTGKAEMTTFAHLKTTLANTFIVTDVGNAGSATKLQTARNINGVAFDGTANITVYDSTKEPTIDVGTTAQYWRGDKSWQTLNKAAVGLGSVDNTTDSAKNVLSATKLTTARTINGVSFDGSANITVNAVDATARIATSLMGVANGVATLDSNGIILTSQLPSYVDDVLEYTNLASFPATGETGKIYVAKDTNKTYRWGGSTYVYITSGAVDSVNGYTGVVVLSKSDVGLSNVVNFLQWHDGNHPVTVGGYGLPAYPTTLPASDVYTWAKAATKPSYAYAEITSKPTYLSQFTNDLGNYGGWITGINSGMITTALGYTPLPTRTFGSAANNNTGDFYSAGSTVANSTLWNGHAIGEVQAPQMHFPLVYSSVTGSWCYGVASQFQSWLGLGSSAYTNTNDHILNQNSSAQSANMWISGNGRFGNDVSLNGGAGIRTLSIETNTSGNPVLALTAAGSDGGSIYYNRSTSELTFSNSSIPAALKIGNAGAATFASTVNATQFNAAVSSDIFTLKLNNIWANTITKFSNNGSTGGQNIQVSDPTENVKLPLHLQPSGGIVTIGGQLQSTVTTGTAPFTVNSTTMVGNLNAQYLNLNQADSKGGLGTFWGNTIPVIKADGTIDVGKYIDFHEVSNDGLDYINRLQSNGSNSILINGSYNIYHSGNLTNNLSTNYIPKWNGSTMVNSLISDDGASTIYTTAEIDITNNAPLRLGSTQGGGATLLYNSNGNLDITPRSGYNTNFRGGSVIISSTTSSTSPTTGALVVGGGIGVGGDLYLGNNTRDMLIRLGVPGVNWDITSNASHNLHIANGDGPLITFDKTNQSVNIGYTTNQGYKLAVNGTGYFGGNLLVADTTEATVDPTPNGSIISLGGIVAAKKIQAGGEIFSKSNIIADGDMSSGGAISANYFSTYESGGEIVPTYQDYATSSGSTSGSMRGTMPVRTGTYKKVILYISSLNGKATYTFPVPFTTINDFTFISVGGGGGSLAHSLTAATYTGAVNCSGMAVIEGY